ncbi:FecCD family ABC transporter permease [Deferrisoma camini]|uniref:FecCD family ABC transporter permease n=1 Tax=Deferrisoma camini TaxID=1035120 RepID=UPI00046D2152|nr:iron ABC transporter permease [Deferrisoma camini]
MTPQRRLPWAAVLPALVLASLGLSLWAGSLRLSWGEIGSILLGNGRADPTHVAIVLRVRLPRAALAALVGAGLGAAGGAFQGLLRNPLADPYILGVSGGAALGAVAALSLGLTTPLAVPAAAFLGAVAALGFVYVVARAHRGSPRTLILSGVMVGSFCSALLLFLLWTSPSDPVRTAIFWLAGDLSGASPGWLPAAGLWAGVAFLVLWLQAPALDLLTQGEETAADLGLDVGRARLLLLGAAGGLTAAAVALAGLVGFVGLVVPHAVRLVWGPGHRRLLPASALLGAAFLLGADAVARTVLAPAEVPVGVVTALVGAPFFLYLLRQKDGRA